MPEQLDSAVVAFIAQLEAERDELNTTIALLRRKAQLPPASESGAPGVADVGLGRDAPIIQGRIRSDEFFRLSISDAIKKYLSIMKQPQNPREIVNGLKQGGVLTNAKNFAANVNTELKRMKSRDVVVNTPSGWGLAEWYPARPRSDAEPAKKRKRGRPKKSNREAPKVAAKSLGAGSMVASKESMNWREFVTQARLAGKSMEQASVEWNQRKASGG